MQPVWVRMAGYRRAPRDWVFRVCVCVCEREYGSAVTEWHGDVCVSVSQCVIQEWTDRVSCNLYWSEKATSWKPMQCLYI